MIKPVRFPARGFRVGAPHPAPPGALPEESEHPISPATSGAACSPQGASHSGTWRWLTPPCPPPAPGRSAPRGGLRFVPCLAGVPQETPRPCRCSLRTVPPCGPQNREKRVPRHSCSACGRRGATEACGPRRAGHGGAASGAAAGTARRSRALGGGQHLTTDTNAVVTR